MAGSFVWRFLFTHASQEVPHEGSPNPATWWRPLWPTLAIRPSRCCCLLHPARTRLEHREEVAATIRCGSNWQRVRIDWNAGTIETRARENRSLELPRAAGVAWIHRVACWRASCLQVLRYRGKALIAAGLKLERSVDTVPPLILMADGRGKSALNQADPVRGTCSQRLVPNV